MLETKELVKTYKPKKGVPVTAVDHVSLRFPEKGMVFLLGKSGSGKSTMLNLLGGLDQYDGGEIIIKGISSKNFDQQRFDSYRNTYVGFIFQEYNVLEEFTVGANIALALELQGRTATDDELNRLLKEVDLEGFGDRKPNELSGGQKQRVAIARALVKNPEIIMADEPTGALDSNTGRQVLDTLKKLSSDKLVIIVSHDREYAEQYADRIIELADGKVIRDVESAAHEGEDTAPSLVFRSASIEIPPDYHLTEEDRVQINEYLDKLRSGASLMLPGKSQRFTETDESKIPVQDGSKFNLIKSKLPMKSAFKIGCSSLKHKRFRLVMTILLSVAAFTMAAAVDTFGSYNHIRACTDSLIDSNAEYVSISKSVKHGGGINIWWDDNSVRISEKDLEQLKKNTGLEMNGIFNPRASDLSFGQQYDIDMTQFENDTYPVVIDSFCGFTEITQELLDELGYKLAAGKLPDGSKDEIAISAALAQTFVEGGYRDPVPQTDEQRTRNLPKVQKITSPVGMIGKKLLVNNTEFTVSGVVETGFDIGRYAKLGENEEKLSTTEQILNYMLRSEYDVAVNNSLTGCAMVGKGRLQSIIDDEPDIYPEIGSSYIGLFMQSKSEAWANCWSQYYTTLDKIPPEDIVWADGEKKTLGENDFVISLQSFDLDGRDMDRDAIDLVRDITDGKKDLDVQGLNKILDACKKGTWTVNYGYQDENGVYRHEEYNGNIVGCIRPDSPYAAALGISQKYADSLIGDMEGLYESAISKIPSDRDGIEKFVRWCYPENDDITERYSLNHAVTYELDTVNSALKVVAKVFFGLAIGFAIFAALLMANFITTSIHYKRQEIGILRAIGSRSADVFRIFFSESFVIAMINFGISALFCFTGVMFFNMMVRKYTAILVTVLHFGIRQVLLLLLISVAIAAIASFLPVHRIASKRPIDAIRDK